MRIERVAGGVACADAPILRLGHGVIAWIAQVSPTEEHQRRADRVNTFAAALRFLHHRDEYCNKRTERACGQQDAQRNVGEAHRCS
jgi:hypothetical protein